MREPLVSVISLTRNRCRNVVELLCSLRQQSHIQFAVILFDNGSEDDTVGTVKKDFPWIHLIETGKIFGMVAYNLGFDAAQGEYILVIDDNGPNSWPQITI